jgi:hypothetical protein
LALAAVRFRLIQPSGLGSTTSVPNIQVVQGSESIAAAIERALPGSDVMVEPGEYRERLILKEGIRVVSRVPRGATIRLPISASDGDAGAAVVAEGLTNAELAGFRIIGDAATPLGVGISVTGGGLSIVDAEITGATKAGIDFGERSTATLLASDIHDNPGAAMIIRAFANPRVTNNVFTRNGMSERASGNFVLELGSTPKFEKNVFVGLSPDVFVTLDEATRLSLKQLNWFIPTREIVPPRPGPRGRSSTP